MRIAVTGPALAGRSEVISFIAGASTLDAGDEIVSTSVCGRELQLARVLPGNLHFASLDAAAGHARAAKFVQYFREADAVLFVLDSQVAMYPHNIAALGLFDCPRDNRPIIYLANKQDLPMTLPPVLVAARCGVAENKCRGTVATAGMGVREALEELVQSVAAA